MSSSARAGGGSRTAASRRCGSRGRAKAALRPRSAAGRGSWRTTRRKLVALQRCRPRACRCRSWTHAQQLRLQRRAAARRPRRGTACRRRRARTRRRASRVAPVNAPRSWPKNSLPDSVGHDRRAVDDHELALAAGAGRARGSARATSSLPVPLSPVMSTGASVNRATSTTCRRTDRHGGLSPTSPWRATADSRSSSTSRQRSSRAATCSAQRRVSPHAMTSDAPAPITRQEAPSHSDSGSLPIAMTRSPPPRLVLWTSSHNSDDAVSKKMTPGPARPPFTRSTSIPACRRALTACRSTDSARRPHARAHAFIAGAERRPRGWRNGRVGRSLACGRDALPAPVRPEAAHSPIRAHLRGGGEPIVGNRTFTGSSRCKKALTAPPR